jgi:hypothetical protein
MEIELKKIIFPMFGVGFILYSVVFLGGGNFKLYESFFWLLGIIFVWHYVRVVGLLSKRNVKYLEIVGLISGAVSLLYVVVPNQLESTLAYNSQIEKSTMSSKANFVDTRKDYISDYCPRLKEDLRELRQKLRRQKDNKTMAMESKVNFANSNLSEKSKFCFNLFRLDYSDVEDMSDSELQNMKSLYSKHISEPDLEYLFDIHFHGIRKLSNRHENTVLYLEWLSTFLSSFGHIFLSIALGLEVGVLTSKKYDEVNA